MLHFCISKEEVSHCSPHTVLYVIVLQWEFMDVNGFGVKFGNDFGCSSLSLLGISSPHWVLNLDKFQTCTLDNWFLRWSTLAVSPVSSCATQPHLVLIGWIPDGYSALCGIGWEISVRPEWWPWLLVVQRWMAWPISGSQNSWRAWWRGGWRRHDRQTSLDRGWVVDPQVGLWSWRHGGCRVWHNRRDRGSVGEVSGEGLVRDTLHAIARVRLHCSPHVAIYWRVGQVIGVPCPRSRLCFHTAVHTSFSGGDCLSAVRMRQQGRLIRGSCTEEMLLWDGRWCLQIWPLTS